MNNTLKERHPMLMVPEVFTFGVVIYTNGGSDRARLPAEAIRSAIVAALPPGTGVGPVTATNHGVYTDRQGAA